MRTRHGKTGAISVSCPFISLHYSAFPLALRNASRETVDLSCLPSERSRRQCATYPADKKREKERNRASKWANERERERERKRTGVRRVMDVRYHHGIVAIFRAYTFAHYRKPWDLDFFERNVFYSLRGICQSPMTTQDYIAEYIR